MDRIDRIKNFYLEHLTESLVDGTLIRAPCPFCSGMGTVSPGEMIVDIDPNSFFLGYFRCGNRCRPGGFHIYFGRLLGTNPNRIPDFDPEQEPFIRNMSFPKKNINADIRKFQQLLGKTETNFFQSFGISPSVLLEMKVGFNGRYLVYPYFSEDGNCYTARCVVPGKEEDAFWHGDNTFAASEYLIYNIQELDRCDGGALFLTEGEDNLLTLKEQGYPCIAVQNYSHLETLDLDRFSSLDRVIILMNHTPEAQLAERSFATRLGYKARIARWPAQSNRGTNLSHFAKKEGTAFKKIISTMIGASESCSPFASPAKENACFLSALEKDQGKRFLGIHTGLDKMDQALGGLRGINIMGGQPKAGKSCFFIQISTELAQKGIPVIYYDFENGRQKIYTRILCRISRLSEMTLRMGTANETDALRLHEAQETFKKLLIFFRVVTDRKLSPELMKRQIDFLYHETRQRQAVVVIDSLQKLPFKNLSERRTGIDEWLRNLEAIRDEQNVTFMVISELSRDRTDHYGGSFGLGAFKESGEIEYCADNALILAPEWDPRDSLSSKERKNSLYLVASRENNPGKIGDYLLDYPFWGFKELS